ncbi:MAG: DUF1700 domain-containing protein [Oscillospiraceae bacterium]|jgi:hypothetical protein|nr:DUF1700 domain-containing protein [Oscillospiraceae bacterium]
MNKQAYLNALQDALDRHHVPDAQDILAEYEQHFAFKLADGYTEEEVAARLARPQDIAAQYAPGHPREPRRGMGALRATLWVATGLFSLVWLTCYAFAIALFAAAAAAAVISFCLLTGLGLYGLIPGMPYAGAVPLALCLLCLAALLTVAALWFFAATTQNVRVNARWRRNALAESPLPPLPWYPPFAPEARRALRGLALLAAMGFCITFVIGYIVLALHAGALEFWHVWRWFETARGV